MSADILDDSLPRAYVWTRPEWVQKARKRLRTESGAWATPVVVYANGKRTVVWYQPDADEIHARDDARRREERRARGDNAPLVLPNMRRVFPGLVAHEVTAVQPMSVPAGGGMLMSFEYAKGAREET